MSYFKYIYIYFEGEKRVSVPHFCFLELCLVFLAVVLKLVKLLLIHAGTASYAAVHCH